MLLEYEMLTLSTKEMNTTEDALIELARTAGSFVVTLVDQDSISCADPDAAKPIIEGLTKFVLASNFLSLSF